jgi:transcriptional regulator GlxA family with amidase domain
VQRGLILPPPTPSLGRPRTAGPWRSSMGMDPRIKAALELLDSACGSHLAAADVAGYLGLSRSRFMHLFKRETGTTFRRKLRQVRLAKAAGLLVDLRLRVKEIAFECGYAATPDLTRAFGREFGVSPSQYRRSTLS